MLPQFTIVVTEHETPYAWDDGEEAGVERARVVVYAGLTESKEALRSTSVHATVALARTYADGVFTGLRVAHPGSTVVLNEVSRETTPDRF